MVSLLSVSVWQQVIMSDASLGTHPQDSVFDDEDVEKPYQNEIDIALPLFVAISNYRLLF